MPQEYPQGIAIDPNAMDENRARAQNPNSLQLLDLGSCF
jgi:hypothetical protein